MAHFDFQDLFGGLFTDSAFTINMFDFAGMNGKGKGRAGRAKNKYVSKAQVRREQKQAEKLFKEFSKMGFGGGDEDSDEDSPKKKATDKKANNEEEEDWDTEEEYTDEEDDKAKGKGDPKGKNNKEEENDDDFEDVDSDEEDANDYDDVKGLSTEEVFLFPIFMDEKSTEVGKKMKCKIDNKVFKTDDELFDHFDSCHKKDFQKWVKNKK